MSVIELTLQKEARPGDEPGRRRAERFFTSPSGVMVSSMVAMLLWGTASPFIKLSYRELGVEAADWSGQLVFAGYRFILASFMILLFAGMTRRRMPRNRDALVTIGTVSLFLTFFQYICFYFGMSQSSGMYGAIISGTTSFFQLLLAHLLFQGDRMNRRKTIGLLLGFAGLGVLLFAKNPATDQLGIGIGELWLIGAALCGGSGNILVKRASGRYDVIVLTGLQMLAGGLALLGVGASHAGLAPYHFSLKASAMLVYLAVISAVGFVLWNLVMKYNSVGRVSMYMFLIPVFGVLLSSLLLDEPLSLLVFAALGLIVAGILFVNRTRGTSGKE